MMKILITGPQGSGKTTQAQKISEELGLCMVKMGELLRERAKVDDEVGRSLKEDMQKGLLVNNQVSSDMMKEELARPKCANGFIVDGYPRSYDQLRLFDPAYDVVIYLDTTVETSIDRLIHRHREDDTPNAIKQRLALFEEETQKTVEHYEKLGKVRRVNGELPVEQVTAEILEALKEHDSHAAI
jgi:adenylate kinase